MTTHTADSLTTLITGCIEPDIAERVLASLAPLNGQLITTRLLDKLPGGRIEWRMRREMGRTYLRNRAYIQTKGDALDAVDLTLAKSEASVPLDVTWLEIENERYYAGRRQRNAQRATAISDRPTLIKLAVVMNEIVDLNNKLVVAKTLFIAVVERGGLFADRYELERACGLREENRQ